MNQSGLPRMHVDLEKGVFRVVPADEMLDYLEQAVQDGAEIDRCYDRNIKMGDVPDLRRMVQISEDITFQQLDPSSGQMEWVQLRAGGYVDTTDPTRMTARQDLDGYKSVDRFIRHETGPNCVEKRNLSYLNIMEGTPASGDPSLRAELPRSIACEILDRSDPAHVRALALETVDIPYVREDGSAETRMYLCRQELTANSRDMTMCPYAATYGQMDVRAGRVLDETVRADYKNLEVDIASGQTREMALRDRLAEGNPCFDRMKEVIVGDLIDAFYAREDQREQQIAAAIPSVFDSVAAGREPSSRVINGQLYHKGEDGLYAPTPLDREEAEKFEQDPPPKMLVNDETGDAYRFVPKDRMLDYLDDAVCGGAVISRCYMEPANPESRPELRRMVRLEENIAVQRPIGKDGGLVPVPANKGDYIDTTDPTNMTVCPASLQARYTSLDRYMIHPIGSDTRYMNFPSGADVFDPETGGLGKVTEPCYLAVKPGKTPGIVTALEDVTVKFEREDHSEGSIHMSCKEPVAASLIELTERPMTSCLSDTNLRMGRLYDEQIRAGYDLYPVDESKGETRESVLKAALERSGNVYLDFVADRLVQERIDAAGRHPDLDVFLPDGTGPEATARPSRRLVAPEMMLDYVNDAVQNGAVVALAAAGKYGKPDFHRLVQLQEDACITEKLAPGVSIPSDLKAGDWIDTTDPTDMGGVRDDVFRENFQVFDRYVVGQRGANTRYLNFAEGSIIRDGDTGANGVVRDTTVLPVNVLFNENDSVGEVVPLEDVHVPFTRDDGSAGMWSVQCKENFIASHADLSETDLPREGRQALLYLGRSVQEDRWAAASAGKDTVASSIRAEELKKALSAGNTYLDQFGTEIAQERGVSPFDRIGMYPERMDSLTRSGIELMQQGQQGGQPVRSEQMQQVIDMAGGMGAQSDKKTPGGPSLA